MKELLELIGHLRTEGYDDEDITPELLCSILKYVDQKNTLSFEQLENFRQWWYANRENEHFITKGDIERYLK